MKPLICRDDSWSLDNASAWSRRFVIRVKTGVLNEFSGHPVIGSSWEGLVIENLLVAAPQEEKLVSIAPHLVLR